MQKNYICIFIFITFVIIMLSYAFIFCARIINYTLIFHYKLNISNSKKYIEVFHKFKKNNFTNYNSEDMNIIDINNIKNNYCQNISFIIDILLGLIFTLLPLIHNYNINIRKLFIIMIGIGGIIGFLLTFYNIYIINNIKNNFQKEYYLFNKSSSIVLPINNGKTKDESSKQKIFTNADNNNIIEEGRDYFFAKFKDFKNNKINNYFDNYIYNNNDNYLLNDNNIVRWFIRFIVLCLNLFLAILGFILYRNSNSSEKQNINRFKKN